MAEFAIALPAIALVLAFGIGGLVTGARQVVLQDAAADAARLAARGETGERVEQTVHRAVPDARIVSDRRGELICITVIAPAAPAVLGPLSATGCGIGEVR
ncbi:TadE family type IV pilus minor pilin [Microbacter sp. GSS18]|nr:TadE family type IV pilus minor pilin [Microbacter sp. GSS18]